MSERLIPNGDSDFLTKLGILARALANDPQRFALSDDDAQEMMAAFTRFDNAFQQARCGGGTSEKATRAKAAARAHAARLYKRAVNIIKISEDVDDTARIDVGLRLATGERKARTCPQEPPYLTFMRALHVGSSALPIHELRFLAAGTHAKKKPRGAQRLELFVDLVVPGEPVPGYPGQYMGNRPWFLRSYSRSPIRLTPPIARLPILVVYWGRWSDATGAFGPFCKTVVSRIEGWQPQMTSVMGIAGQKRVPILEDQSAKSIGPAGRDERFSVAVLDAQFASLYPQGIESATPAALPSQQRERRQLEGPVESEAA